MRFSEKVIVYILAVSILFLLAVFIYRAAPVLLAALGPFEGPVSAFFAFVGAFACILAISFGATRAFMYLEDVQHEYLIRQRRREQELLRDYYSYTHRHQALLRAWFMSSLIVRPPGPQNSHDSGGGGQRKGSA